MLAVRTSGRSFSTPFAASLCRRRRGREGSYPPSPRTDPGVRIFAPGSSDSLASAILHLYAIPCGEVCLAIPALHVRTRFPMQAATACQPLPHVNGFPVSEYCGLIRPPKAIGSPTCCFGSAYLFCPSGCTTLAIGLLRNLSGLPSSCRFSRHMPRSKVDPGRPSECSPKRILCVGFCSVETIAICTWTVYTVTPNNGAVSSFRKCGLPCGLCRSLCTLQLCRSAFASSTTATLSMNGWLGLIHQGLSPWMKRQASLGAPTACVSRKWAGRDKAWKQESAEA